MVRPRPGFFAFNQPSPDPAQDNTKRIDHPVFLCPTVPDWTNIRNSPYGYNYQFLGNSRLRTDGSNRFVNFPVRAGSARASDTVLAADAMGTAAGKPAAARSGYRVDGGGDVNALGQPRLVPRPAAPHPRRRLLRRQQPGPPRTARPPTRATAARPTSRSVTGTCRR